MNNPMLMFGDWKEEICVYHLTIHYKTYIIQYEMYGRLAVLNKLFSPKAMVEISKLFFLTLMTVFIKDKFLCLPVSQYAGHSEK